MAMQATKAAAQQQNRMSNDQFTQKVSGIGDMLRKNQVNANSGRETKAVKQVDAAYKEFLESIKDQKEFLKHASDEQKEVFKEIFEEFTKLRKDGKVDFERSNKEFQAAVARINEVGGDGNAKQRIEHIAALGMKHTEAKKPQKGVIRQEIDHRIAKFIKPTGDELESPLFRKLAGLDKKGPGNITPLAEMQNLGKAEALKKVLGDDITGDAERDKAIKLAQTMGEGKDGKGGGAFPSKIENLNVENLIVKNVRREEAAEPPRYMQPAIGGAAAGKSAVAINPQLEGPGGSGAAVHPQLPAPSDPHGTLITHEPSPAAPQLEYSAPKLLPSPKHDAEDVEFREAPIKVKPMNPHNPLRTKETPLASAVRGAVNAAPMMAATGGVVGALKASDELPSNDVGPRASDATLNIKDGDASSSGGPDIGTTLGLLTTAASALLGKKKGKGEEKENAEEKEGEVKEKTKGASEEAEAVKGEKGLGGEVEGVAAEAKGASKFLKGASKIGKVAGIAGVALTAYNSYGAYNDADKDLAAGKITAQQAKEKKSEAVGGGLGSVIGGYAGSAIGGIAGSFLAPGVGTLAGGAAGGYLGSKAGEWVGDEIGKWWAKPSANSGDALHKAANHSAANQKPNVVVVPAPAAQAAKGGNTTAIVPTQADPRTRESYFDRAMMGTLAL
jgi:hypothetical protein